jgi:mannan endo-1,4-beta-mannosidase
MSWTRRTMAAVITAGLLALTACSGSTGPASPVAGARHAGLAVPTAAPSVPFDVGALAAPAANDKFMGVTIADAPFDYSPITSWGDKVGKQPDVVEEYISWGDQFDAQAASNAWKHGALYYIAWEPFSASFKSIADGEYDSYIKHFASQVHYMNLPVAISFAHEMNGYWYPWGTQSNTAAEFVKAWQHIHNLFLEAGATNVVWVWSPNDIGPVSNVQLKPYYPGDAYVDWIGIIGYYTNNGAKTFATLFQPTVNEVRTFSQKPIIIPEVAAEPGPNQAAEINDLFSSVEQSKDVLGFIWFNYDKTANWQVQDEPAALAAFRQDAASPLIGVDMQKVAN